VREGAWYPASNLPTFWPNPVPALPHRVHQPAAHRNAPGRALIKVGPSEAVPDPIKAMRVQVNGPSGFRRSLREIGSRGGIKGPGEQEIEVPLGQGAATKCAINAQQTAIGDKTENPALLSHEGDGDPRQAWHALQSLPSAGRPLSRSSARLAVTGTQSCRSQISRAPMRANWVEAAGDPAWAPLTPRWFQGVCSSTGASAPMMHRRRPTSSTAIDIPQARPRKTDIRCCCSIAGHGV